MAVSSCQMLCRQRLVCDYYHSAPVPSLWSAVFGACTLPLFGVQSLINTLS